MCGTPIKTTSDTSFVVTGLTNGTYYYVVTAVTSTGESQPSNCESVTIAIPPNSDQNYKPMQNIPGFELIILGITSFVTILALIIKIRNVKLMFRN